MTSGTSLQNLRILYVGARIVGYTCLEALLQAGAQICGLLHLDDSKAGMTTAHTSFRGLIRGYGLHAQSFTDLKSDAPLKWARGCRPDIGIVVGVSQLLSAEMLQVPRQGFLGMHPTMLPEGRGRAPIPWAIIKGLKETGVSWFWCKETADSGDLLIQRSVPVHPDDTSSRLGARTDQVAAELLVEALPQLAAGSAPRTPQNESRATHWGRRRPEDGVIDWTQSAEKLYDWVRALTHPYPGAFTRVAGKTLFLWSAKTADGDTSARPGQVVGSDDGGVLVATGNGVLRLLKVQWQGGAEMAATKAGLKVGDQLGEVV